MQLGALRSKCRGSNCARARTVLESASARFEEGGEGGEWGGEGDGVEQEAELGEERMELVGGCSGGAPAGEPAKEAEDGGRGVRVGRRLTIALHGLAFLDWWAVAQRFLAAAAMGDWAVVHLTIHLAGMWAQKVSHIQALVSNELNVSGNSLVS
ncbi:hypothetical protein ACP70R_009032 [Stipagrostis hirtigluma subsp. patula]